MVGTRMREIGIRIALGASRARVVTTVLSRGLLRAPTLPARCVPNEIGIAVRARFLLHLTTAGV
jgi:hypothetical protein